MENGEYDEKKLSRERSRHWDEMQVPKSSEKVPHVCTNSECEVYMREIDYWPVGTRVSLKSEPEKVGTVQANMCSVCNSDLERVGLASDPR